MKTHISLATMLLTALPATGAESFVQIADERAKIEQAIPAKAIVQPLKPRRLLIFTLKVGYGGHPSIALPIWDQWAKTYENRGAREVLEKIKSSIAAYRER